MQTQFQLVADSTLPQFIDLMREFYAAENLNFNEEVAKVAVRKTLMDSSLGSAYLILVDKTVVGYFALTFGFSLEFHGKFALMDELYIRQAYRRQKLGKAAIEFAEGICKKMGIKALRLEVGHENEIAQNLYRRMNFRQEMRHLFTKWL